MGAAQPVSGDEAAVEGEAVTHAEDPAEYDALVDRGLAAFEEERWRDALEHFDRAHALQPSARTLRARGVALYRLGELPRALRDLRAALEDPRHALTPELRAAVAALVARIESKLARVRLHTTPEAARLRVDGMLVELEDDGSVLLPPGSHRLRFGAPGHAPVERELTLSAASSTDLVVELSALPERKGTDRALPARPATPPAASPVRRAASSRTETNAPRRPQSEQENLLPVAIAAGAAVAFAAAAAGFWLAGDAEVTRVGDECRAVSCDAAERMRRIEDSDIGTFETLTNVSLALSGASLLTAGVLYLLRPAASSRDPSVDVALRGSGIAVQARF